MIPSVFCPFFIVSHPRKGKAFPYACKKREPELPFFFYLLFFSAVAQDRPADADIIRIAFFQKHIKQIRGHLHDARRALRKLPDELPLLLPREMRGLQCDHRHGRSSFIICGPVRTLPACTETGASWRACRSPCRAPCPGRGSRGISRAFRNAREARRTSSCPRSTRRR